MKTAALFVSALLFASPLAIGITSSAQAKAASARHYDCSKPGNANKTACKSVSAQTTSAPPPVQTASVAAPKARNYDCNKAGNANKAACKAANSNPALGSESAMADASPKAARNYDCSKAGNKNKAVCKSTALATAAPTPAANQNTPAVTHATPATSSAKMASTVAPAGTPAGATAQCRDGSYSFSQHHSGTCSHHGGVAKWL